MRGGRSDVRPRGPARGMEHSSNRTVDEADEGAHEEDGGEGGGGGAKSFGRGTRS